MNHEEARQLMAEATEGRLSERGERDLALHLVSCAECKSIYEGLQQADPALSAIAIPDAPSWAVDAAVFRAATVLRGEADPGPAAGPGGPVLAAEAVTEDESVEEQEAPAPPPAPSPASPDEDDLVRRDTGPLLPPDSPSSMPPPEPKPIVIPAPKVQEAPAKPARVEAPLLPDDPIPAEPEVTAEPPPPVSPAPLDPPGSRTEIRELLGDRRAEPALVMAEEADQVRDRPGPGSWLVAIAITIALAVLAAFLITRGQTLFGEGGGDLPSAEEVQTRMSRVFSEMSSLKANFELTRLGLHLVESEGERRVFSFSNGTFEGRLVYDRAEGHRQEHVFRVRDQELLRERIVRRSAETRSLVGAGAGAQLVTETNPALGPPDGVLRPHLGVLEDAIGSVARMITEAPSLEVVDSGQREGRATFRIRFAVEPDEFTRADQIEAEVDANSFLPVVIRRSISSANARVLGPESALSDQNIQTAFGEIDRATTEVVELSSVSYDEIILPGDYVLDIPDGVEEQERDGLYRRLPQSEAPEALGFNPLLPEALPEGFVERNFAIYAGEQQHPWGPGGAYPAPEGIAHSSYFDGKTTIAVAQRRMAEPFDLEGSSPLAGGALPVTVRPMSRDEKNFTYGISPELPPHVFGFLGNTFVVVSGYAPADLLATVFASFTESVAEAAEPLDLGTEDQETDGE